MDKLAEVQQMLLAWYRTTARDLPWRKTRDPYAILVSEMMFQQTQVDRVVPRWQLWLKQFPTLQALAEAPRAEVIRAWSGLGYNLRAVRLHDMARQCVLRHGGSLPCSMGALLELKGLGRYTAGAVACFGFGEQVSVVDTNVRRVLSRVFLGDRSGQASPSIAQQLADATLPKGLASEWNQALMDLGATICTAAAPACVECPLATACQAAGSMSSWPDERRRRLEEARADYRAQATRAASESSRLLRGAIVKALSESEARCGLELSALRERIAAWGHAPDEGRLRRAMEQLARDGLLLMDESRMGTELRLPEQ